MLASSDRPDSDEAGPTAWSGAKPFAACIGMVSLLCLTCFAYLAALGGPFLLDDFGSVLPSRPSDANWSSLAAVTFGNESGSVGRPLTILSFALQFLAGADGPASFKLVNLCIHLVNTVLFALLLDRLFITVHGMTPPMAGEARFDARLGCVFVGVVVFALHPLQVSTVMYVVQRMALMSHTFGLAAALVYVIARLRPEGQPFLLAALPTIASLIGLSVLSKESGVLVLSYIALIELIVFRGARRTAGQSVVIWTRLRSIESTQIALIATVAVTGSLTIIAVRAGWLDAQLVGYSGRRFTLMERLASQPVIVLEYLRMIVWPDPLLLSFHHDDVDISTSSSEQILVSSIGIAGLFALAVVFVGSMPLVSVGLAIYLASHLLESTIFPLEPMFEHRNYVGLSGVGLVCAGLLVELRSWILATGLVVFMTIAFTSLTVQRAQLWSDDLAIERHAVKAAPKSLRARSGYAIALARRGSVDAALLQLDAAANLAPDDPYFPLERLQTLALAGRATPEDSRRVEHVLETGEPSLPTEAVLLDLRRNLEAGRLSGLDASAISDFYFIAERRYGGFSTSEGHARMMAAAAEAHVLAGREERALESIDRATLLAPAQYRISVRRLEMRAGLDPTSIDAANIDRLEALVPGSASALHRRLGAVRDHLNALDGRSG